MLTQRLSKRLQLSLNHNLQRLNVSKVPGTITSLFLKGVAWGWFIFLGVPPMLTTISLIPTEWILMISHLCYTWWLGYSRKNSNRGGWGYTFSFFYFTLGNSIATKQSSTPGNSTKLCSVLDPLNIPGPKTKTPGNCTLFFQCYCTFVPPKNSIS